VGFPVLLVPAVVLPLLAALSARPVLARQAALVRWEAARPGGRQERLA
jgi:hypothetical protein